MAWIELHQTLPTNRKTMRFKRLLKIKTPQAVGHMCMLWLWAIDNAPDGDLSPFGADEIAEAGGYTGKDPHAFVDALVGAGFVDDDGTSLMIHEWYDYVGNLVDKRAITKAQNRERAQRYRDKRKQMTVTESVTERDDVTQRNADVTRDGSERAALRNADVTTLYSTVPYSTNTVPCISEERKVKERSPEVQPATDVTPPEAVRPDVLETKNRLVVQADMPKGRKLDELPEGMRLAVATGRCWCSARFTCTTTARAASAARAQWTARPWRRCSGGGARCSSICGSSARTHTPAASCTAP